MNTCTLKSWILVSLCATFSLFSCARDKGNHKQGEAKGYFPIILVNNQTQAIPFTSLDNKTFLYINLCKDVDLDLLPILSKYDSIMTNTGPVHASGQKGATPKRTIILSVDEPALDSATISFIKQLAQESDINLTGFGPFELLRHFDEAAFPILWTEATSKQMASKMASALFGGEPVWAKLPQNVSARYIAGSGYTTDKIRLGYTSPTTLGIDSQLMERKIDKIVEEGIAARAYPGAVVLVAKDGNVIFEKAYGHHTYDQVQSMRATDIFDMASITKIAATTLEVMKLKEEGKIDLDKSMGYYLPNTATSNKNNTILRDVMLHQAGFTPFIPFYRNLLPTDTSRDSSALYPTKLADGLFIRKGYYQEVMWPEMLASPLSKVGEYVYSDLSMYVMKEVIEKVSGNTLDELVLTDFYEPLGMYNTGFQPRKRFEKNKIVPTEDDQSYRHTLLQGYVHDQGAAMVDGISGHAGLFSTANDLAIYGQVLLNNGQYGGRRYFEAKTRDEFASRYSAVSRRGLGFDRWDPDTTKSYPSKLASPATFGHTGYTGTCIWIDPSHQLTYVFLSNRVHPEVSTKLADLNIRSRIQDAIYEAIGQKAAADD